MSGNTQNIHGRLVRIQKDMKTRNEKIAELMAQRSALLQSADPDKYTKIQELNQRIQELQGTRRRHKEELNRIRANIDSMSALRKTKRIGNRTRKNKRTTAKSVSFSDETNVSVLNRLGRPLKPEDDVYQVSRKKDYKIKELLKGPGKEYNQVITYNMNQDNGIHTGPTLYSKDVIRLDQKGQSEIQRITDVRNFLKLGLIVEHNNAYYVIEAIHPAPVGSEAKHMTLNLLRIPEYTSGTDPRKFERWTRLMAHTKVVPDYDVSLIPIDRLKMLKEYTIPKLLKEGVMLDPDMLQQIEFGVVEPVVAEPAVSEPAVSEPAVSEPAVSEPAVSEPAVAASNAETVVEPAMDVQPASNAETVVEPVMDAPPASNAETVVEPAMDVQLASNADNAETVVEPAIDAQPAYNAETVVEPAIDAQQASNVEKVVEPAMDVQPASNTEIVVEPAEASNAETVTNQNTTFHGPVSVVSAQETVLGGKPNKVSTPQRIQRLSIDEYKALMNKKVPVILQSATEIEAINGYACEFILDNLSTLDADLQSLTRMIFFPPRDGFDNSIAHVLGEQICFIILFHELFTSAIVNDSSIKVRQSASFTYKFDAVQGYLNKLKLISPVNESEFETYWNHLQAKYIHNTHRHVSYEIIKGAIIADPKYIQQYFDEGLRVFHGEAIDENMRFYRQIPGSASHFPNTMTTMSAESNASNPDEVNQ